MVLSPPYKVGDPYRVLYQDAEGDWHQTAFSVAQWNERVVLESAIYGEVIKEEIPTWVKERARIVTAWI